MLIHVQVYNNYARNCRGLCRMENVLLILWHDLTMIDHSIYQPQQL